MFKHKVTATALILTMLSIFVYTYRDFQLFSSPTASANAVAETSFLEKPSAQFFIQNTGQFDPQILYQANLENGKIWIMQDAIWLTKLSPSPGTEISTCSTPIKVSGDRFDVRLSFPGQNPDVRIEPFNRSLGVYHYFKGNDPLLWQHDVQAWGGLQFVEIFPGIDLVIQEQSGTFNWQFIPSSPSESRVDIRLKIEGADTVLSDNNRYKIGFENNYFTIPQPFYAGSPGSPPAQPIVRAMGNNIYEIQNPFTSQETNLPRRMNAYPEEYFFGTYLGGGDYEGVFDIKVIGTDDLLDRTRSVYLTGYTTSVDFPTVPGISNFTGDMDIFVTKLRKVATLVRPEFSVLIGGTYANPNWSSAEGGNAIDLDEAENIYITGSTRSQDFPTTIGAFDRTYNGDLACGDYFPPVQCMDAFLIKLDKTGNLVYSTYFGGSGTTIPGTGIRTGGDESGEGLVYQNGFVYLTGYTASSDFPTTPGAYDRTFADESVGLNDDVFAAKFQLNGNGSSDLLYSSFIGGGLEERAYDLAIDQAGIMYIAGYARGDIFPVNSDFPITPGAIDDFLWTNDYDSLFIQFAPNSSGKADLLYATFLGGDEWDRASAVAIDDQGSVYLTGETRSPNFLTTQGAFDRTCGTDGTCNNGSNTDIFVSKFNPLGNGLADLSYSTYLGGAGDDGDTPYYHDIALSPNGEVFVASHSSSADFPITHDAYNPNYTNNFDAVLVKMSLDGFEQADLKYSTYIGGSGNEYSSALALAEDGGIYVAGKTSSTDFPTSAHGHDRFISGQNDGFVFRLKILNATTPDVDTYIQAPDLTGTAPDSQVTIPIQYGNFGLTTAENVEITATLGVELIYVSDTVGIAPSQPISNTLVWALGDLDLGAANTFSIQVAVPDQSVGVRYPISLEIHSHGPEFNPANNRTRVEIMLAKLIYLPTLAR